MKPNHGYGPIENVSNARYLCKKWQALDNDADRWRFCFDFAGSVTVMIDNDEIHLEPIMAPNGVDHSIILEMFGDLESFDEFGYDALCTFAKTMGLNADFV